METFAKENEKLSWNIVSPFLHFLFQEKLYAKIQKCYNNGQVFFPVRFFSL